MLLLLLMLTTGLNRSLCVHHTEVAPQIDGYIESVWESADSAYGFIQSSPYEKSEPSESTTVYVLQDDHSLYFAFRCMTKKVKPLGQMTGDDDAVTLYLDPFCSKTTAYYFRVCVSGTYSDGLVLDDGRSRDSSWDGVWFFAVKSHSDCYQVEIKIPFKSIRYKKGLSEWGVNFSRYMASRQETDYWTEVLEKEGCLVSKYGSLVGINPKSQGYYFEVYPEAYLRGDKEADGEEVSKVRASLNFKWDITPQATLNATTFPDFAQIESDPFTLNLSRYETYLSERRPFFLEGKEIFRMADFGSGGFYNPLEIFYSRRIGKAIGSELVPILGGVKLTSKSETMEYGFLGAYTDKLECGEEGEPRRCFGVLRAKRSLFTNSDVGVLLSGTRSAGETDNSYNYAVGLDLAYRSGANQLVAQAALSGRDGKVGSAFSSGFMGFVKGFLTIYSVEAIQDSFDVADIGYVPWSGRQKVLLVTGPYKEYSQGFLKSFWPGIGAMLGKEPATEDWSKLAMLSVNTQFRNNWGGNIEVDFGPYCEADTNYFSRGGHISVWGSGAKYSVWFGGGLFYDYNYSRGFLAYSGSTWQGFYITPVPHFSLGLNSNIWIECDTTNSVIAIWPMATPRIYLTITPKMELSVFDEFVFSTPGSDLGKAQIITNRVGLLFSYNFKPKSWLYIALNDHRVRDSETGTLILSNRVTAIKAKYLISF